MNIIERKLNDVTVLDLEGALALEGNKQFRNHKPAAIDFSSIKLRDGPAPSSREDIATKPKPRGFPAIVAPTRADSIVPAFANNCSKPSFEI
jgi:hypothetical protein